MISQAYRDDSGFYNVQSEWLPYSVYSMNIIL